MLSSDSSSDHVQTYTYRPFIDHIASSSINSTDSCPSNSQLEAMTKIPLYVGCLARIGSVRFLIMMEEADNTFKDMLPNVNHILLDVEVAVAVYLHHKKFKANQTRLSAK